MPKATIGQVSFSAGEVSPLVQGRVDSPRYRQGLAQCLNRIPTIQGPILRTPGTKYLNNVKDSTKPPILIPFTFSATQAYILELGDQYMRFYANNGQVVTAGSTVCTLTGTADNFISSFFAVRPVPGSAAIPKLGETSLANVVSVAAGVPLELKTPFLYADLSGIKFTQSGDTLYLFHPSYFPQKLQRFGTQDWRIRDVYFQDGPYGELNSDLVTGDSTGITLAGMSNALLSSVQTGPTYNVTGVSAGTSGQIQVTMSGGHTFVSGQNVYIIGVGGTTEANNVGISSNVGPWYWTVLVIDSQNILLLGSVFTHAWTSGGTVQPALFGPDVAFLGANGDTLANLKLTRNGRRSIAIVVSGKRYWGVIVDFSNAASATVRMGPLVNPSGSTVATGWYLGAYYNLNYPSAGCFHQNRLVLVGAANSPQQVNGSQTAIFEGFAPSDPATLSVNADNAYQFNLNSSESNALRWVAPTAQGLLSGSYAGEWALTPSSQADAITPTNVNAQQTSSYGAANVAPVQIGNGVIYVQRAQKKVRELHYFFQVGTFRSTDLTEVSEHITLPSITQLVVQKETQPLIWGLRSDGILTSLTYNRDDASVTAGWARHQLGGQSDSAGSPPKVVSMGVIPSPDISFDQLWLVVKRYINGATVYTIEYMTKIFDDSTLQEDSFYLSCGATFDNPKTISGLSIASTAVVTANAHGFSNGDQVRIVKVTGLNESTTDVDGNTTISNLVNEKTFVVAGVTTNTFQLNDFSGNPISSVGYSAYVSGGEVRKLVTTISGLTWLENETVGVLTDGGIHPDAVISNSGVLTLNYPAAKVQIGYRYNSDIQLLRAEAGAANGTAMGQTRRTHRAAFLVHNMGDLQIGTSFTRLIPVNLSQGDQINADNATPLFSGIIREGLESAYDFESQICVRQNSPLPGAIVALVSFLEEFDA